MRGETPGQHRADQEDADADQEDGSPAVQVGELAVERTADGGRQQVGRERPRVDVIALQVGDDARQRRAHDRLVERRQEDADHDREQDAQPDRLRQLHRRAVEKGVGVVVAVIGLLRRGSEGLDGPQGPGKLAAPHGPSISVSTKPGASMPPNVEMRAAPHGSR